MASSKEFKTRDNWKKEKELEEARKAGTAAPLQDEDGRDINPHIPQYIAQAPWYLNRTAPSLKHQRIFKNGKPVADIHTHYPRGAKKEAAEKFRKGACTNCGAMTHKAKDCVERPRARGAKHTGRDIKPDEYVRQLEFDFEGKRDRWNGYDPDMHDEVVRKFDKAEMERRRRKAEALAAKFMTEPDPSQKRFPSHGKVEEAPSTSSSAGGAAAGGKGAPQGPVAGPQGPDGQLVPEESDSEDEDLDADGDKKDFKAGDSVHQSKDPRTRTTSRNLRIREDTAKYLRNLSLDSAYYDPKTRSMRENPTPHKPVEEQMFSGDNFTRSSGDSVGFGKMQSYAWEAYEKGQEIHLQGAPSQAELLFSEFQKKKKELEQLHKEAIRKKYGAEAPELPKELLLSQTENYVEYARDGTLLRGQEVKVVARSKYEEDVTRNNHTSVWGSYWEDGEWGYACCKQLVRNSYCTGEAGRLAKESIMSEMAAELERQREEGTSSSSRTLEPKPQKSKEEEEEEKQEKLAKAIKAEEEKAGSYVEKDERKRGYNWSAQDTHEVTEEEMEAYRMKRSRMEDPMAHLLNTKPASSSSSSKRTATGKSKSK